jgi:hypothetical protein
MTVTCFSTGSRPILLAGSIAKEAAHPLQIILTHGMAPYECFKSRRNPGKQEPSSGSKKIDGWLATARKPNLPAAPPAVLFAYRDCGASPSRYPNSGEVFATLLGRRNLRGLICEVCKFKVDQLRYVWEGRHVEILDGSWRTHLGRLACPESRPGPWLFSMDPMTFDPAGQYQDDATIRPCDLERLNPIFRTYLGSGLPGAIAVFCFSLRKKQAAKRMGRAASYEPFQKAIGKLAHMLGCHHVLCEVSGSNPHVGGLLSGDATLIGEVKQCWDKRYREVG